MLNASQICPTGWRSGDCGHVQVDDLSFCDMVLSSWKPPSENWYTVVIKRWTWSATILRLAVVFKWSSIATRSSKCAKKTTSTPLHHQCQSELLIQGRMDPCFHVVYSKFWPYQNLTAEIKTSKRFFFFFQSSIAQFWWAMRTVASVSGC